MIICHSGFANTGSRIAVTGSFRLGLECQDNMIVPYDERICFSDFLIPEGHLNPHSFKFNTFQVEKSDARNDPHLR